MGVQDRHPLCGICQVWLNLIEKAEKQKKERWGKYAKECYNFYNLSHNFMWDQEYASGPDGYLSESSSPMPTFKMTLNKISDGVDLFGPTLLARYPQVVVEPKKLPQIDPIALGINAQDPYAQQQLQVKQMQRQQRWAQKTACAAMKQHYLNWLQVEAGKKEQAKRAITEAIITGLGLCETKLYSPRNSQLVYPRSEWLSVDQYGQDPDASRPEDVLFIYITRTEAVNQVERKLGLKPGTLRGKGQQMSLESQSTEQGWIDHKQNVKSDAWDLITYHEIYSKNGFGQRNKASRDVYPAVKSTVERFGDVCKIVVAKGVPFPLNIPDYAWEEESFDDVFMRAQWEIPFSDDDASLDDWPVSKLYFKEDTKSIWPISPFKPVMGLMRFVNWAFSFMADKVATGAVEYIAMMKGASDDIRKQLKMHGKGIFRILEIDMTLSEGAGGIDKALKFLDKPNFDTALWTVIKESIYEIEKGTGLNDILYAMGGTSMRSATEAELKGSTSTIRVDDWADKADDWYTTMAVKEMQAAAWALDGQMVSGVFDSDQELVYAWDALVRGQGFEAIVRDYNYTLASNSARKPNKAQRLRSLNELGQTFLPVASQMAMGGNVGPWNAYMKDVAESLDLPDPERYLLQPPQQQGPSQEEMEAQKAQQEMQMKQAEHQMKLAELQAKLQAEGQKTQLDAIKSQQEVQSDAIRSDQSLREDMARATLDLLSKSEEHDQKLQQNEELHDQKMRQAMEAKNVDSQPR